MNFYFGGKLRHHIYGCSKAINVPKKSVNQRRMIERDGVPVAGFPAVAGETRRVEVSRP